MTKADLKEGQAAEAANRSSLYAICSQAFRYPAEALYAQIESGELLAEVQRAAQGLRDTSGAFGAQLERVRDLKEMEQAYLELFELGGPAGPPCLMYEGEYGGGRLKVMEDVLRFYDHFGLDPRLEGEQRDRPDHFSTELEFMHFLAFKEACILEQRGEPTAYRQGQREFLRFHLLDFAGAVAERAVPRHVSFYSELAALAQGLCRLHLGLLSSGTEG